ncbi:tryptophan transporter [Fictibacillus enclensis]|uniref:Tryptophan transporter n=1 Tax=Fictibacillus enclensis TaxID=1017270 RepID=A0A0V8JAC0_9BACL|nr:MULTISPECIES: tryptophan transporter [Fictibacillus]KSU84102.1 tryptophan transporter [Fictibacillus enclensis]MDM5336851.1 tryptophan transporter [Fictibacillus enclensis]RXZ00286.1 tryptophan transporter [Fictibacillus sp. S7]WHY73277.1 tryptophan transporter [Fictibacillus enclensis]SCB73035.1 Tryptophan transporter TrpP [Fictibacillus enclensis]
MKTRSLAITAVLLALGYVLHAVMPPLFLGMRPDMMLTMLFLTIIMFPALSNVIVAALATGVITAITTTFPGGQIANLVDKPISALVFLALFLLISRIKLNALTAAILTLVGTMVSGSIFLGTALLVAGLPGTFSALFLTVVLPTAAINCVVMFVIYPVANSVRKRTAPQNSKAVAAQNTAKKA